MASCFSSSSHTVVRGKVGVIGMGVTGLASLKNLREQGFDAVGLERNHYVGGLWKWTESKGQVSVLKTTVSLTSKQGASYSDFPFPENLPDNPTATQFADYLHPYAEHFDLFPHIRLGMSVTRIQRSEDGQAWQVLARSSPHTGKATETSSGEGEKEKNGADEQDQGHQITERYERLLVCTGPWTARFAPTFPGQDEFKGDILLSREYKQPEDFAGKRVAIIGMGITGCEDAVSLVGHAKQVYISHRAGVRVPADHSVTRRRLGIAGTLGRFIPTAVSDYLGSRFLERRMKQQFPNLKREWNLLPAPPVRNSPVSVDDTIIDRLHDGSIISLGGVDKFYPNGIVTKRGVETDVDVVIYCTGSYFDYGILAPEADPTSRSTPEWDNAKNSNGLRFPRLYQTIFPPSYADSLAFLGPCRGHSIAACSNADLASSAIGQVWKGLYTLPSQEAMEKWCDGNYKDSLKDISPWRIQKTGHSSPGELEGWLNKVAGNEVNEKLGWGWEGWKFWWKEGELYRLIMDGVNTSHVYRLWDGRPGGRIKWEGARDAIYRANGKELKRECQ